MQSTKIPWLWRVARYWLLVCSGSAPLLALHAQTADRVVVQAPSIATKARHLNIAYGVTDMDYRRQVLALTPLGSTYDQVCHFVVNEWAFQRSKLASRYKVDATQLRSSVGSVERNAFTLATRDLVREETPHIEMASLENPFAARSDRQYMYVSIIHRPHFWERNIDVGVYYVFDAQHRLIDAFADSYIERPISM